MELIDYIDRVHARTARVARCIPREQLEWTYREGKFTLGDLVRHLAAIKRWMFAENVAGRPSSYPGHGRELADGLDEVLAYLDAMHGESMQIFRGLTPADLERKCMTPGGAELSAGKWIRSMIEHESHHRGQIYLYLSILGVETPPLYGLTSEQVRERSVSA